MVSIALLCWWRSYANPLLTLASAVIVGRELFISALRDGWQKMGKRARSAVSYIGKLKTHEQMLAIFISWSAS